jgi:hypothetical protein
VTEKIWTHSANSHFLEPKDLWHQFMPKAQADRMPRIERVRDGEERVHVDGTSFVRAIPKIMKAKGAEGSTIAEFSHRPPGLAQPARAPRRPRPGRCVGRSGRMTGSVRGSRRCRVRSVDLGCRPVSRRRDRGLRTRRHVLGRESRVHR